MNKIVISVIIPVYNSEKYINKCINSVLSQSFTDFEIIAVDDGSTDSSLVKLNEISNTDARLKVYSKVNGGVSSARNFGIERAEGEFITFVDSDDTLPKDALKILYDKVNDSIDLVSGSYQLDGFLKKDIIHKNMRFSADERLTRFEEQDRTNWGPCGKLYRKSIIDAFNVRFREDIYYSEDHIFNLNYTKTITNDILVLSDIVYCYNNGLRQNLCSRSINEMAYVSRLLFETILEYFDGNIEKSRYDKHLFAYIVGSIDHYIVRFPKKEHVDYIRNTFREFEKYIDVDFINSHFSKEMSKAILQENYSEFVNLYKSDNPKLYKRRIKNTIKGLLLKLL